MTFKVVEGTMDTTNGLQIGICRPFGLFKRFSKLRFVGRA